MTSSIPKFLKLKPPFTRVRPWHLLTLFALLICLIITLIAVIWDRQPRSPISPDDTPCPDDIGWFTLLGPISHQVDFNFGHEFVPTPGWNRTIDIDWGPERFTALKRAHGEFSLEWFQLNRTWLELRDVSAQHPNVKPGGSWSPEDGPSPQPQVAIIIKYRDRLNHLKILLDVLHTFLKRQKISYRIFVAEQYGNYSFNRGALPNAAFITAMTLAKTRFDCFIFHDVDLVPENLENLYNCDKSPQHLAAAVDKFDYTLPYPHCFGGVVAFTPAHFLYVNGYPNTYWGWGGEDDDLSYRTTGSGLTINRRPPPVARYTMLGHQSEKRDPNKYVCDLLRTARTRYPVDGLSTLKFRLLFMENKHLYTHMMIDLGLPPPPDHAAQVK